ncbi:MAG: GNAT family N-acetyltransferase [Rikenellaceae bacterium]|nr:GNAT family N-acetyltransferase [Rikenellaceae bacterium]
MIKITDFDTNLYTNFLTEVFPKVFPDYNIEELSRCIDLTGKKIIKCAIALYDNIPAGFMFYREFDEFIYCEYIGVDEKFRNKGIASEILEKICKSDSKQWIFEVEKERSENKTSNIFRKIGFVENPFPYDMPRAEEINPNAVYTLWSKYPLSRNDFNHIYTTLRDDNDF